MSSDISSVSGAGGGGVIPSVLQIKSRHLIRPPTPETILTERPNDPDISIFCESCGQFIGVRSVQEHRGYHSALLVLGYKGKQHPENVKTLLKRRQNLTRDLKKNCDADNPLPFDKLQKINDAYELLKVHLENEYSELIQTRDNVVYECRGISLNSSTPCVKAVGICSDDNSRWKSKMEDTRVFQDYYGNDASKCFFAIYDGYNGRFTADITANDLHHVLLNELQKVDENVSCTCTVNLAEKNDLSEYELDRKVPIVRQDSLRHILHEESVNIIQQIMHTCEDNLAKLAGDDVEAKPVKKKKHRDPEAEKMAQAFNNTYYYMDRYLSYGINERSLVRWSGCSALTCIIDSTKVEEGDGEEEEESKVKEEKTGVQKEEGKDDDKKENQEEEGGKDGEEEAEGSSGPPLQELGVIHLANAGNVHAVLCRAGKAYRLSKNHTLSNTHEKTRVLKAGASVQAGGIAGRVNGILDTTRGLGNYGDPHLKKAVTPEPYTTSVKLDQHAQFIVMATCGLWDVLTDDEVCSLVRQMLLVRHVKVTTASMPGDYYQEMSEVTTFGEDFGDPFADGLDNNFAQMGFDNTLTSVVDIDGTVEAGGKDQGLVYVNPPNPPVEDSGPDVDDSGKSQIIWNDPLVDRGQGSDVREGSAVGDDGIRVSGEVEKSATDGSVKSGPPLRNYQEEFNDVSSVKTDFESMISALCDDGNEADIETLTELHTIYAQSRLSEGPAQTDNEEYRMLAQSISERLVQSALMAGSRDNITVMVILLRGCKI